MPCFSNLSSPTHRTSQHPASLDSSSADTTRTPIPTSPQQSFAIGLLARCGRDAAEVARTLRPKTHRAPEPPMANVPVRTPVPLPRSAFVEADVNAVTAAKTPLLAAPAEAKAAAAPVRPPRTKHIGRLVSQAQASAAVPTEPRRSLRQRIAHALPAPIRRVCEAVADACRRLIGTLSAPLRA